MVDSLSVRRRDAQDSGTRHSRRLRATGFVPAILYGQGQDSVSLAVPTDALQAVLRHHGHVVSLGGDLSGDALIKEVQYDTFGQRVLHVDFIRVKKGEAVEVTLAVETFGDAPGVSEGGVLETVSHQLTISCPAMEIPELLRVDVSGLQLGQSVTAGDVSLPKGASLVTPPETVVAHVVHPVVEPEAEPAPADDEAQPEVIGESEGEESTDEPQS